MIWFLFLSYFISRIKKLIDIEALGLSRLSVIVLDMHTDVKGYSLFTLPQVRSDYGLTCLHYCCLLVVLLSCLCFNYFSCSIL